MNENPDKPDDGTGNPGGNDTAMPPGATTGEIASNIDLDTIAQTHAEKHDGFDAAIHAVNEDGTPKRKADGSYALKRGRKAGRAANALPPKNAANQTVVGEPANPSPSISLDEASRQSANLVINACVWTLGNDLGKPFDKSEAEGLKLSFRNYYEVRGIPQIPPEIGLLLALGSYIGPRLMTDEGQAKIKAMGQWLRAKTGG